MSKSMLDNDYSEHASIVDGIVKEKQEQLSLTNQIKDAIVNCVFGSQQPKN